jgi:hypothetical protein
MKYDRILDNIKELASDKLNDWECGFIDDISMRDLNYLTDKEKTKIREIQDKYLKY